MNRKSVFMIAFFAILMASGPLFYAGWVAGINTIASRAQTAPSPQPLQPLQEAGSMSDSASSQWWVNSGGIFYPTATGGSTIFGDLSATNTWHVQYATNNPVDTDIGFHPQNIFRLVSKAKRSEVMQQAYFTINTYHLSSSPNRNQSNGILFFNRYMDSQNLYYVGVRVDGYAIVKKKKNGIYYTMAQNKIIPSGGEWNVTTNPNELWMNTPIGMRSEVRTFTGGRVGIRLYIDVGKTGVWKRVADVIDDGVSYGGASFLDSGYGGIRTDFMDASFEGYVMDKPPAT